MIRTSTLLNLRHTIFRMHSEVLNIFTELISLRGCHPPSDQCSDTDIAYQIYFYRNLQLPNHVIIIKTNLLLPQSETTLYDFAYPVYVLWFSCVPDECYSINFIATFYYWIPFSSTYLFYENIYMTSLTKIYIICLRL